MTNILEKIRFKTLIMDIVLIVIGCFFCIIVSKYFLKDSRFYINMFYVLVLLYVVIAIFVHFKFGYLKEKKFKNALHTLYHTDNTYIKIGNPKDKYGSFYKDNKGFIFYHKT